MPKRPDAACTIGRGTNKTVKHIFQIGFFIHSAKRFSILFLNI